MSINTCFLTTKDFTILEVMRDRRHGATDPLASILKTKIESAIVVFREDIPSNVATLNSNVTYRCNNGSATNVILAYGPVKITSNTYLPINTIRGLALLGLSEGQEIIVSNNDGFEERIFLERVEYQPEAVKREKDAATRSLSQSKPTLRLINGSSPRRFDPDGYDDPGPAAA